MTTPTAGERGEPGGEAIPQAVPSPIARVLGQPYHELPQDLFIPPDALEVFLDTFEGPLDLLLYLIRRQQLDILNLPILQITSQYMEYVELMQGLNLELARIPADGGLAGGDKIPSAAAQGAGAGR